MIRKTKGFIPTTVTNLYELLVLMFSCDGHFLTLRCVAVLCCRTIQNCNFNDVGIYFAQGMANVEYLYVSTS